MAPTQPLRPPTTMAGASAEAPGHFRQIVPPPGTGVGASKLIVQQRLVGLSRSIRALKPLPQQLLRPTPSSGASATMIWATTSPPSTSIKDSKQIVQQLTRSTGGSKPIMQQLVRPTSLNGGSASQPSLQPQPTASIATFQPVHMPTSPTGVAQPLIRPSMIRFGPFQPSFATTRSNPPCQPPSLVETSQVNPSTTGSKRPCQPPSVVGTSQVNPSTRSVPLHNQSHLATVKVARGSTSQASRESPSNANNDHEDLARSSRRKGDVGGKQKKSSISKSTRSSQSSWKDNIQFDAKEEALTIDDQENEEVIKESILPRDVMNYKQGSKFIYPADKGFDKRVLKHVAKHFKQYKHSLKRDYFKPEEKTREDMNEIVPKGHSRDRWMRLTLAEIGRDARASQTHCHTTGSTSYAEKRADFNEATSKVQERLLTSSPSKTQVEIQNEVFDELKYEEKNPKRPIDFGFNVDRSDIFGVNVVLRKRGYSFPNNNMELKRVKEELASQKAMFLIMLKAVRNGKVTDEFLDDTGAALRMAGDQIPEQSSGNDLSNESRHTGPSTSASQVN
ncbi:hypothetical protein Cgig2_032131 [Carnegiea gigantea]|uniref:Uncharacterized protein n=1 Tax=Carnegiea gigantea TaxID=171969 RepID=A0A9Q1GMS3_9CARY|nr:hypothetical protein Cgig2_032131 [Carnegiea gigantea]